MQAGLQRISGLGVISNFKFYFDFGTLKLYIKLFEKTRENDVCNWKTFGGKIIRQTIVRIKALISISDFTSVTRKLN